jgi:hypothetical protein
VRELSVTRPEWVKRTLVTLAFSSRSTRTRLYRIFLPVRKPREDEQAWAVELAIRAACPVPHHFVRGWGMASGSKIHSAGVLIAISCTMVALALKCDHSVTNNPTDRLPFVNRESTAVNGPGLPKWAAESGSLNAESFYLIR